VTVCLVRGDAARLPLADDCVDLIVTSPPFWSLRSYTDGGDHFAAQIGAEPTPIAYVDNLIACTREWVRALKPSGSLWVNLGDKYAQKSLVGLPWRYALRCTDELGLTLRAEVIWSKPNGLPESVTDRVRRSHETWFHLTAGPRYFAAVDAVRLPHGVQTGGTPGAYSTSARGLTGHHGLRGAQRYSALGRLPGSVWTIASHPLRVPAHLGVDHFAAFPMEWPRRIILGWSPSGICTACGEDRRPVSCRDLTVDRGGRKANVRVTGVHADDTTTLGRERVVPITGEACACPDTTAPTRPAVVLDPFGGTGTTAMVASALGRTGVSVDMSADYCRLAAWRTADPKQRERAARPAKLAA
jgi:hypothetical protein